MATASTNLSEYNKAKLPNIEGMRFGIVVSEWNAEITEALCKGAIDTLKDNGCPDESIIRIKVPGTFELPMGAKLLSRKYSLDAIIAIGVVIQGETRHFDYVCQGVTQGIMTLNTQLETPVIFCVLTDDHIEQSRERSGGKHGNKGVECAISAMKMADLKNEMS